MPRRLARSVLSSEANAIAASESRTRADFITETMDAGRRTPVAESTLTSPVVVIAAISVSRRRRARAVAGRASFGVHSKPQQQNRGIGRYQSDCDRAEADYAALALRRS